MVKNAEVEVQVGSARFSNSAPLTFIGGLCSMESESLLRRVGRTLKEAYAALGAGFVLKCSFDKANGSSLASYRGKGMLRGLEILKAVGGELGVPVITDVHEASQADLAARYVDILQIPAFLCRQTDLLLACGRTGLAVNIKKGQFLSPWDIKNAVRKVESTGNRRIMVTERGTTFGYGNLVVDMRALAIMKELGYPVIYDATHSVQLPGALGHATGGQREFVPSLARAAAAVGIAGIFLETHHNPDEALSDGPNSLKLADVNVLSRTLPDIDALVKRIRQ